MIVAIDGPAGAGKSTLSRRLAADLGFLYVDTGAMYRAIGLFMTRRGIDPADAACVVPALPEVSLSLRHVAGEQRVFLGEEDVSEAIRLPEISLAASAVSAIPAVRDFLLQLQRDFGRQHSVLMDGRDIGTVVFPDAQLKIFLTASAEDRARRRFEELRAKGLPVSYEEQLAQVRQRDAQDENRAVAPLRPAADAVVVDTSGFSFEQSYQTLRNIIEERMQ